MPSHSFENGKTLGHFFEPLYLINFRGAENAVQVTKSLNNIKNTLLYPNTICRCGENAVEWHKC